MYESTYRLPLEWKIILAELRTTDAPYRANRRGWFISGSILFDLGPLGSLQEQGLCGVGLKCKEVNTSEESKMTLLLLIIIVLLLLGGGGYYYRRL